MANFNEIKEGMTVKYFGHECKVTRVFHDESNDGMYHVTMTYPNPLMMDVTCFACSHDGNFKDISL